MKTITYSPIEGRSLGFGVLVAVLGALLVAGGAAAYYMEHQGHYVTGMSNQIVWGMPHVFAVFLIVAASGALNVASVASVFNKPHYKPLSRMSGLLAVALLTGGLVVLVLDLGRPDRLVVAMTTYNFKSIFAWNIFLYTGFMAIVAVYLWMMMERKMNRFTKPVGLTAFIWRLLLTTGTGSIFGFLVARQGYDAAVMAPLFVAMSFSLGLSVFMLVIMAACAWTGRPLGEELLQRLKRLLGIFIVGVLYFVLVQHLTNLYAAERHGIERYILLDGGIYTKFFWLGQILVGSLLPLVVFFAPATAQSRFWIGVGASLVILGGFAQLFVIIIGVQSFPLQIFPGKEVVESGFFDGVVAGYVPSLPEMALGIGGVALSMLMVTVALRVLGFLPASLSDEAIGHRRAKAKPAS